LAAHIKDKLKIEAELIASGGGVFEVRKDEILVFSKRATGRFPEADQIIKILS
jgi:selT/selW/selH-like putative selenoprotein